MADRPTMATLAKEMNNGKLVDVIDVVSEVNAILDDLIVMQANSVSLHKYTKLFEYPRGEWRRLNAGVGNATEKVGQGEDHCGILEIYSEVDKRLAKMSGNARAYRRRRDTRFTKGLGVQMAETSVYGNHNTNPEEPQGLAPRYNALSLDNVVSAGGTTGLTSIWVVQHGEDAFFGFYGQGGELGLRDEDLGEVTLLDASNKKYQGYRTHFEWELGFGVADDRCVRRICNVPTPSVIDPTQFAAWENLLIEQVNELPDNGNNAVIYVNKDILTQMTIKANEKSNAVYTPGEIFGKKVLFFQGVIPIRRVDAILSTETEVA